MFCCIAKNCGHNNYQNECRFYSLPKDAATFEKWEKYLKCTLQEMQHLESERLAVCSCHLPYYDKENVENIRPSKRLNFDDSIVAKKSKKETVLKTLVHNEINRESLSVGNGNSHAKRIGIDVTKQVRIPIDLARLEEETKRLKHQNEVYRKNIEIKTKRSVDMAVKGERLSRNLVRLEYKTKLSNEQKEIYRKKFERERKRNVEVTSDLARLEKVMKRVKDENKLGRRQIQFEMTRNRDLAEKLEILSNTLNQESERLKDENKSYRDQIEILTKRISNMNLRFEFAFIEDSDMKVHLHTGLPSKIMFNILLKMLTKVPIKYYSNWVVKKIPQKEQLIITLMKLKMNVFHFDLAQRFGWSISTITNIVRTWILLMYELLFVQLMKTIPSRHKNKESLPVAFQTLCDCRMVMDATEIMSDTPINMNNQRVAYSGYKHYCTCKGS